MAVIEGTIALSTTLGGQVVDPLTTNRETSFTYQLTTNSGSPLGPLEGVADGTLSWAANAQVKGGGKLRVIDVGQDIDWLKVRIKPTMHLEGVGDFPLGVWIPSAPKESWWDGGREWDIELLDRTSIIAQDAYDTMIQWYPTDDVSVMVPSIIASTGESYGAWPDAPETPQALKSWEAGTSKLTIVNDILQAANYWTLWNDENGEFRVEKYVPPKDRPIRYELLDGNRAIYEADFTVDIDIYSIPNKVIAVSQGSGSQAAWTSVATNNDPNSPYSFENRGRWITDVQTGIDTTSQENLDAYAKRRLAQLTSSYASLNIQHAPVPGLRVNDVVRFRRAPAGIDTRFVVTKTEISLDPTGLAKTTLRELVDLE